MSKPNVAAWAVCFAVIAAIGVAFALNEDVLIAWLNTPLRDVKLRDALAVAIVAAMFSR